jgi:phage terminase large subunit-like protein
LITDGWVEQMRSLLPGPAFDRVIGNRWTSESGDFVSREQWRRCVDPGLAERAWTPADGVVFVGLDLGLTHDRTAMAAVYVDKQTVVLDELIVWQGSREEPVQIASVERALVDLKRRHPRLHVTADPWQLKASIQRLSSAGISIEEFAFAPASISKLSALLYETISGATLRVFDDRQLEEEILGLQVVQRPSGWRFDHRAQGYSDRAVALAMATRAAIRYRPGLGKPRPLPEPDYAIVNPGVVF